MRGVNYYSRFETTVSFGEGLANQPPIPLAHVAGPPTKLGIAAEREGLEHRPTPPPTAPPPPVAPVL